MGVAAAEVTSYDGTPLICRKVSTTVRQPGVISPHPMRVQRTIQKPGVIRPISHRCPPIPDRSVYARRRSRWDEEGSSQVDHGWENGSDNQAGPVGSNDQSCCTVRPARTGADWSMDRSQVWSSSSQAKIRLPSTQNLCQCCAGFSCLDVVPKGSIANFCTILPRLSALGLLGRQ